MKNNTNESAVLHTLGGFIKKQDVEPGTHEVGPCQVLFTIPAGVTVTREPGTKGDGTNEIPCPPATREITLADVLLFLSRAYEPKAGDGAIWLRCLRDSPSMKTHPEDLLPKHALTALEKIDAELALLPESKKTETTPAKRNGANRITFEIIPPGDPKAKGVRK